MYRSTCCVARAQVSSDWTPDPHPYSRRIVEPAVFWGFFRQIPPLLREYCTQFPTSISPANSSTNRRQNASKLWARSVDPNFTIASTLGLLKSLPSK